VVKSRGWKVVLEFILESLGISIVDSVPQEVLYAKISDVKLAITDDPNFRGVRFSIEKLQIDNQLYNRFAFSFISNAYVFFNNLFFRYIQAV
jgi:hypothetical protein